MIRRNEDEQRRERLENAERRGESVRSGRMKLLLPRYNADDGGWTKWSGVMINDKQRTWSRERGHALTIGFIRLKTFGD